MVYLPLSAGCRTVKTGTRIARGTSGSRADVSKSRSVTDMLCGAVRRGSDFEYVLFDSWFFPGEILARIESSRTRNIKLIAMFKMNIFKINLATKFETMWLDRFLYAYIIFTGAGPGGGALKSIP
jgi:hypothetical protein